MFCTHCGKEISANARFCPGCGAATPKAEQPRTVSPRNRILYVLLAFFLGCFGIHNFYAGRLASGLIQLLLTLFSCGLGALLVVFWVIGDILFVTSDGEGRKMEGSRIVSTIFALLLLGLSVLFLLFSIGVAVPVARVLQQQALLTPLIGAAESDCQENLDKLGKELQRYFDECGHRPAGNNDSGLAVIADRLPEDATLACPVSEDHSYIYLGGCMSRSADCPLVFDYPGVHNSISILYADGHTATITPPDSVQNASQLIGYLAQKATTPETRTFLAQKQKEFE